MIVAAVMMDCVKDYGEIRMFGRVYNIYIPT